MSDMKAAAPSAVNLASQIGEEDRFRDKLIAHRFGEKEDLSVRCRIEKRIHAFGKKAGIEPADLAKALLFEALRHGNVIG